MNFCFHAVFLSNHSNFVRQQLIVAFLFLSSLTLSCPLRSMFHCSADREQDGGKLVCHRELLERITAIDPAQAGQLRCINFDRQSQSASSGIDPRSSGGGGEEGKSSDGSLEQQAWEERHWNTATELADIPPVSELEDGVFLLDLHIAPLRMDASPSRPILYPCTFVRLNPQGEKRNG